MPQPLIRSRPSDTINRSLEGHFVAEDGSRLFYRQWPSRAMPRGAVIIVHRGHEHSGRLQGLAERISNEGWVVFAPDLRGHGESSGERGCAPSFATLVADLDSFARHVNHAHDVKVHQCHVIGVSIGGVVATAWVHDYAPPVRSLSLIAPAFSVRLYVPFAMCGLRVLNAVRPNSFVRSYVRPSFLTHDRAEAAALADDPLIFNQISVSMLIQLHDAGTRLIQNAWAINCPTCVLSAGADWVVKGRQQRRFFDRLGTGVKHWKRYAGMCHDLLHETCREEVIGDLIEFLRTPRGHELQRRADLLAADERGCSVEQFRKLQRPIRLLNPRRLSVALARVWLATVGRLSEGIRLGWTMGFDSGQSLDYVYQNRPRGWSALGRMIDRAYLNAVGWQGIRQRREHLRLALDRAIEARSQRGETIRILDVAAGPGRYVLDAMIRHPDLEIHATLCDVRNEELERGRDLARSLNVANVRHEIRNAFDRLELAKIDPPPSIAIVSGLYELFSDNRGVRESLGGLAAAMPPESGGLLIYTCQPWHPQLEFIARVLRNREHRPWVMRLRSQAEMDVLVAEAGFHKLQQWTGDDGLFTVALAERVATPRRDDPTTESVATAGHPMEARSATMAAR